MIKNISTKKERLIIERFEPSLGKHCETSALRKVLTHYGFQLSEEMLFGLGGGIGFIYWYMKKMPYPFIGGRNGRFPDFLAKICERIGARLALIQTTSMKRGHEELKSLLRVGKPAIAYGDIAFLPHFASQDAHFGGHAFVVFGLDEEKEEAYIFDRGKNPITLALSDLKKARASRFSPFSPKHALLKIEYSSRYQLKVENFKEQVHNAIKDCCWAMINPPLRSFGLGGIKKWSRMIMNWPKIFKDKELFDCLVGTFINIEIGGTGGSAFRSMYAQFLREASDIAGNKRLAETAQLVDESAKVWNQISAGLLPDTIPNFKKTRELLLKKNSLFENQEQNAIERMREINVDINKLKDRVAKDLRQAPIFLSDVRKNILRCYDIESRAFKLLSRI